MAENLRLLRTLQRISDTARKINTTARPAPKVPLILKSLPEHKPLLPLLISHGIPSKLAEACADRYDKYASQLRLEAETRLAPHLVGHNDSRPDRVYTLFLKEYSQTLRDWAQTVLNSALKNLKRDSKELGNWDATHPEILWLPSPPNSSFARKTTQSACPLSSTPPPSHAFPTTYPPPLRPPSGLPPVEWRREPATSSKSASTSVHDLDSLCLQFTKSLVIDENPMQLPRAKPSIFSLLTTSKEKCDPWSSCAKLQKTKLSRTRRSQNPPTHKPTSTGPSLKAAKYRQLSVPRSFPSPPSRTKPMPRKASAPAKVSTSKDGRALPKHSDSIRHATLTTSSSPLKTPTADRLDTSTYPDPSTPPLCSQWSLGFTSSPPTQTPRCLSHSLTGPTTPPALSPDLFPVPIVVPSTPVHLFPGSSLMPITDPFLQFHPEFDYFSDPSLVSLFDYSGSTPGVAAGGFFSKSAFDTSIGPDPLYRDIPALGLFENNLFNNTYTIS